MGVQGSGEGGLIRLRRLFGKEEKAVVVAIDHGEHDGPQPGLADPLQVITALGELPDGILMSPGAARHCIGSFSSRTGPLAIVRLNWNTAYAFGWEPVEGVAAEVVGPEDALRLGADIALVSLILHTGSERLDAANVSIFSSLVNRCQRFGLPVIGEYFPVAKTRSDLDALHEDVRRGARIVYELGADCVKTFFQAGWEDVVEGCPIPILGLGSERLATDLDVLKLASGQIGAGARGLVFGRNVFQAPDPVRMVQALIEVVKRNVSPEEAAKLLERPRVGAGA
jgi:DhnA family fructose-bisphosphate aldolase class Ia